MQCYLRRGPSPFLQEGKGPEITAQMHSTVHSGKLNQNCQSPAEEGKVSPRALSRLLSKKEGAEQELYKPPIYLTGQQ